MTFDSDLVRSTAGPIVLRLVSERPMYGYELIKVVNDRTQGAFEWKEGTLYPCLHRLEAAGLIASDWETAPSGRRRKYYRITRKGAAELSEKVAEWKSFSLAMGGLFFATSTP